MNREAGLGRDEQRHAAGLAQREGAAGVSGDQGLLDRGDPRRWAAIASRSRRASSTQPRGAVVAGAVRTVPQATTRGLPGAGSIDRPAGGRQPRIDPQHPHALRPGKHAVDARTPCSITLASMSKFAETFCTSSWSSRASTSLRLLGGGLPSRGTVVWGTWVSSASARETGGLEGLRTFSKLVCEVVISMAP